MDATRFIRVNAAALCAAAILLPSCAFAQRNLSVAPSAASQQQVSRVALVIGNAGYDAEARLKNPVNDANDLSEALRALDFKVKLVKDADKRGMKEAIEEFHQGMRRGGVGLFYFAGHGIMSKGGKNYLIPVRASIKRELDLEFEAIDANYILAGMEDSGSQFNIVILDACRNNPFTRAWRSSAQGGLAQMAAPKGSFIAFATSPNSVAADGEGRNGVFTKHLLTNLREGESAIDRIFIRVSAGVTAETGDQQIPWQSSNLTGIFKFRHDEPVAGIGRIDPVEQAQWNQVKTSTNARDFDAFLLTYPNGHYAGLARDYRTKLLQDLQADQERRRQLEEAQQQQQALIEAERRRLREEEYRLQRQREQDRLKAEQEKKRKGVYVAPTF